MHASATLTQPNAAGARNWIGRAAVVLALSLAAHAVVLGLGQKALQVPALGLGSGRVIEVTLTSSVQGASGALLPPSAAEVNRSTSARRPAAALADVPATAAADRARDESQRPARPATIADAPATASASSAGEPAAADAAVAGVFDASGDALLAALAMPPLGPAALPVSARYVYATRDTRYPTGSATTTVEWRFGDDRRYSAALVTMIDGVAVRELNSTGHVGPFGLAPERYTEKTVRRARWATDFDWEARRVMFGATRNARELHEGMQDRLSFQFQLMALGQRLPTRFSTGATVVLAVGSRDEVAAYRMRVVGHERVQSGIGEYDTVKLERPGGAGRRDSGIEVWLAPEAAWLPVKLRFTDRRGDSTENLLSEVVLPAQ